MAGYLSEAVRRLEAERDRLRAVVDADDGWAGVITEIMLTIDGGRREWSHPVGEQVVTAVAELEAERDRLRAVVDALREWRDAQKRFTLADIVVDISDARDEAETARQAVWLALARWEEQLDGSTDMGGQGGGAHVRP